MLMNIERQMSPDKALTIAEMTIKSLALDSQCRAYGNAIKTYHCQLIDSQRKLKFYGCGKGLGIQSSVSAHFEALEHHALHVFCQKMSQDPGNYFCLQDPLIFNKLNSLDSIPKKLLNMDAILPFVQLSELSSGDRLPYPLYLLDPRYTKTPSVHDTFDYQAYAWQASDSGTASGTSEEEASLHALNEVIERDAYSLFLIKTFLKKNPLRIINKKSVPEHLQAIILDIEAHYAEDLLLIDMTSDIGVPSVLVVMTKQTHLIQPKGCGTSLNRDYALERALLESLQPLHIYNEHLIKNQEQILTNFAHMPLLAQCAQADVSSLTARYEEVDFHSLPAYDPKATLKQQINTLVTKIKSLGFAIYSKQIAKLATGFTCMKIIIPELEQFYLIQAGKYVLPNKRGMRLLEAG